MKRIIFILLSAFALMFAGCNKSASNQTLQELKDRTEIRSLVDRYAVESDRYNQEGYREIFYKDIKLRQVFGERVTEYNGIDEVVSVFKNAGNVKVSFHQVGQHLVDFDDETHAHGTTYLSAVFGNENVSQMFIRYEDKFEKIDGRWWITDRDQIFVYGK